jgi:hypothetical protein
VIALPVTVLVVLDGLAVGLVVGLGLGLAADFVGVGETFADGEPLEAVAAGVLGAAVDGCGALAATELTGAELTGAGESGAELTGADDSGGPDDTPGVTPDSAAGRGAFACVVLKLSRTTSPVTVATKTALNRRMTHPPFGTQTT